MQPTHPGLAIQVHDNFVEIMNLNRQAFNIFDTQSSVRIVLLMCYSKLLRRLWLPCLSATTLLLYAWEPAHSIALTPLKLVRSPGLIQIKNSIPRSIRVDVKVYPALSKQDGTTTVSSTPLPDSEVDQLIRLRPSSFRLGSNAVRNVTYKLLDAKTSARFYVCAETTEEFAKLRICSRWAPPSS